MKVTILSGKDYKRSQTIELRDDATLEDLRRAYLPKVNKHRKTFKIAAAARKGAADAAAAKGEAGAAQDYATLDGKTPLAKQGVTDGTELRYKDLGPQVGYRTVFLVEYAGPLAFMLFYAMRPSFVYGAGMMKPYGYTQKLFISLFIAHFLKRELESVFVHKFSHPTMPLRNIFKNCIYYWSFAAFIGYILCNPAYTQPSQTQSNIGAALMIINEILNGLVHLQLSRMRSSDGDQTRKIPQGPLFSLVSCPNYFFEIMSWVSFSIGTNMLSSWLFTIAGFLQMAPWAQKKHRNYMKTDAKVAKTRKALLPFLL